MGAGTAEAAGNGLGASDGVLEDMDASGDIGACSGAPEEDEAAAGTDIGPI